MNNQSRAGFASADPRVQAALKEYLDRLDNGEMVDLEGFLTRHQSIAEELSVLLAKNADLREMLRPNQHVVRHPSDAIDQKPDRSKTTTHSMSGQSEGTLHEKRESKVPKIDASPASRSREDLPEVFGRYRVQKKLGSGAMGAVYLAEDTLLHRKVALKTPTFDDDKDGELLRRFYREARAVANLKHPTLCAVYDVGELDGRHYISMEYVPGKKLQEFIKPDSPMSEKQAMAVVRKIASGMHEAHMHGVIHRDLKPDNIMINEKGEPVVMDFGLVHKIESKESAKLTQHGSLIGSPAYMPKEQVEGDTEKLTAATDQYSLGVILYQLLTSRLPFEGGIHSVLGSILTKEPLPPSQYRSDINPHLEAVCLKMMAKEMSDRYPTMKMAADAIGKVAKGTLTAAGAPSKGLTDTFTGIPQDAEQNQYTGPLPNISVLKTPSSARRKTVRSVVENRPGLSTPGNRLRTWWSGRPPLVQWSVIGGAGALCLFVVAMLFFQTPYGVLQIEIEDANLSVKFDGNLITVDSDDQPIRVKATANYTLEVLQNGIAVESAKQQFNVLRGEYRLIKVALLDGQITIDGQKIVKVIEDNRMAGETISPEVVNAEPKSDLDRLATGTWRPLIDSTTVLPDPENMKYHEGVLALNAVSITFPNIVGRDVVVRAEVRKISGQNLGIGLRNAIDVEQRTSKYGAFFAGTDYFEGDFFGIGKKGVATQWADLNVQHIGRTFESDQFVEMAFSAVGQVLTLYVEGYEVISTRDNQYDQGFISLSAHRGVGLFRNAEYQILDPPVEMIPADAGTSGEEEIGSLPLSTDVTQIQVKLDTNRATYKSRRDQYHEGVIKYLDKRNEAAVKSGSKQQVDLVKDEHNAFEISGDFPRGAPAELRQAFTTARQTMESAYQTAIRDFTKCKFDDEAAATEKLLEQFKRDSDADWIALFNGRDLMGWTPSEGSKANWKIAQGILMGTGEGLLITDRKDYRDFRLRLEAMLSEGADSGVFFRVQDGVRGYGAGGFGYEAQIGGDFAGPFNTGSLIYQDVEMAFAPVAVPTGQWFVMELLAEGNRFTTWVDGKQVATHEDKIHRFTLGSIGIQTFRTSGNGGINFRRIEIKELPAQ